MSNEARAYVEHLVDFGRRLKPVAADDLGQRRAFVEKLLQLSKGLATPQPAPLADVQAFRDRIMPNIATIMRVVAGAQALRRRSLGEDERAALEVLGVPHDLLGLIGEERSEVAHTTTLGAFLNTARSAPFPALARVCAAKLEELLREARARDGGSPLPALRLDESDVDCEYALPTGDRVDVVLESPAAVVFVEAKIGAEARERQLDDYADALDARGAFDSRHRVLVFLTVRPDQSAGTQRDHVHVTFAGLLRAWLPLASGGMRGADDLARYLKTIAVHLCSIAARGAFDEWPLHVQRRCLAFLEKGNPS